MAADLLPVNLAVVDGFEWCTMHDDIADESSDDPARCAASLNGREPRNAGTHCHLVRLLRHLAPTEPAGRPPTPTLRRPHTHDNPAQLHVGCPGCRADWACTFADRCPDAAKAYLELHRGGV